MAMHRFPFDIQRNGLYRTTTPMNISPANTPLPKYPALAALAVAAMAVPAREAEAADCARPHRRE